MQKTLYFFLKNILKQLSTSKNLKSESALNNVAFSQKFNPKRAAMFLNQFENKIDYRKKLILEVGCGSGNLAILLAKNGAKKVIGVDLDETLIETAKKNAEEENVHDITEFVCADFNNLILNFEKYDLVFSQGSFEHILNLSETLKVIYTSLNKNGILATIFGPLWGSPYGAHMWGFTKLLWVHFLFPEKVVLDVRTEFFRPDDPAQKYEDVGGHLNKITISKFKTYCKDAGFHMDYFRINPEQDKGKYKYLNKIVNFNILFQELGADQLLAILRKK